MQIINAVVYAISLQISRIPVITLVPHRLLTGLWEKGSYISLPMGGTN